MLPAVAVLASESSPIEGLAKGLLWALLGLALAAVAVLIVATIVGFVLVGIIRLLRPRGDEVEIDEDYDSES